MCLKIQNDNSKSVKSMSHMFRSLLRSLQVQIVNKSSNIIIYSPENGDSQVISVEFLPKLILNGETNLTCFTVTPQCYQYVAMVINYWHQCYGLWLLIDLTFITKNHYGYDTCFMCITWDGNTRKPGGNPHQGSHSGRGLELAYKSLYAEGGPP